MKVIRPYTMADAMLISTSAAETNAEYVPATTYAPGTLCTMAATHRMYRCILASTGNSPDTSPLYWIDIGPSNKWAMFDTQSSTQTTATSSLTVTIATGLIDSVALVGASPCAAQVVVRDGLGGDILYDQTISFSGDVPIDWYTYFFFNDSDVRSIGVFENIPPYQSAHLTVTLTGSSSLGIGGILFGLSADVGTSLMGAKAGIIDFSRKATDSTTGITTFAQGAYSKRLSVQLLLDSLQMNRVQRLLAGLRATPCVWIDSANADFEEAMIVYGFYRDFTATISYPNTTLYDLAIEGLI